MTDQLRLKVLFYRARIGSEPVREWLQKLSRMEKMTIGEDLKTVQFAWHLGMPLIRKLDSDLWEVAFSEANRASTVYNRKRKHGSPARVY